MKVWWTSPLTGRQEGVFLGMKDAPNKEALKRGFPANSEQRSKLACVAQGNYVVLVNAGSLHQE